MDPRFVALLKMRGHKIHQSLINPKLKKNAAKFITFAFRQGLKTYQLPKVLKLEKAYQSYSLHTKTNLEPASTMSQQNTPGRQ